MGGLHNSCSKSLRSRMAAVQLITLTLAVAVALSLQGCGDGSSTPSSTTATTTTTTSTSSSLAAKEVTVSMTLLGLGVGVSCPEYSKCSEKVNVYEHLADHTFINNAYEAHTNVYNSAYKQKLDKNVANASFPAGALLYWMLPAGPFEIERDGRDSRYVAKTSDAISLLTDLASRPVPQRLLKHTITVTGPADGFVCINIIQLRYPNGVSLAAWVDNKFLLCEGSGEASVHEIALAGLNQKAFLVSYV